MTKILLPFAVALCALPAIAGDPPLLTADKAFSPLKNGAGEMVGRTIDADGSWAIAGTRRGRAITFRRATNGWVPATHIAGSIQTLYGSGARIHDATALISEALNSDVVPAGGAVEVWTRSGIVWSKQATLRPLDLVANEQFGGDLDGETLFDVWGDWAAVASPSKDGTGAIYVFERSGTTWAQQVKLGPAQPATTTGESLELDDRSLVVLGSMGWDVYRRVGAQWVWLQTLETPQNEFPAGAISLKGDRIAVGRATPDSRVAVFRYAGTQWVHESEVTVDPQDPNTFVMSLAIDGNRLGAALAVNPTFIGRVPLFEEDAADAWRSVAVVEPQHLGCAFGSGGITITDDSLAVGWPLSWPSVGYGFLDNGTVEFKTLRPAPTSFCTGKLNSEGCVAQIDFCGLPGAASQFDVTATGAVGQKPSILFYGYGPAAVPFLGGTLCVAPPLRRTAIQLGGGDATPCSGTNTFDFAAVISSGADPLLVADAQIYCQYWYRDPGDADGVGLTNALSFTIWP